jgi:hypothetical protein
LVRYSHSESTARYPAEGLLIDRPFDHALVDRVDDARVGVDVATLA